MNTSQYSLNAALAQEGAETVERLPSLRELFLDAEAEAYAPSESTAGTRAGGRGAGNVAGGVAGCDVAWPLDRAGGRGAGNVAGGVAGCDVAWPLDRAVVSSGTFAAREDGRGAAEDDADRADGDAGRAGGGRACGEPGGKPGAGLGARGGKAGAGPSALAAAMYEFSILEGGGAVVGRCESEATFLRVPERLGGHDVVGVGPHAFSTCYALEEVVLPETLVEIGRHAFMNTALRNVRTPGALRGIGKSAFFRCEKLETAQLNDGLLRIGVDAFRESGLTRLAVPASVVELGRNAFKGTRLKVAGADASLRIDPGNERFLLADGCLYRRRARGAGAADAGGARPAHSNAFPTGLVNAGEPQMSTPSPTAPVAPTASTQDGTTGGELVLLQALDESMERYAGPAELVRVAGNAFAGMKRLSHVALPEGTQVIADRAFRGCTSLEHVELPDSLRHIGKQAFGETRLRELRVPAALESLGPAALFTGGTVARSFERSIRHVQVAPGNRHFHLQDGLLCQRLPDGSDEAVLYAGSACEIVVPRNVSVIGPYAYMNAGPVRLLRLHSGIRTVDVGGLDFGCAIPVVEFDEVRGDGSERRIAVHFPAGEAGRQAIQMAFGRGLFDMRRACAIADDAILATHDVYARSRAMLERLADPVAPNVQSRGLFEKRLATTACQAAVEFGRNGFLQGVDMLLDAGALGRENIDDAIAAASREGEVAVLSRLLEAKRTRFEAPMFDFDL